MYHPFGLTVSATVNAGMSEYREPTGCTLLKLSDKGKCQYGHGGRFVSSEGQQDWHVQFGGLRDYGGQA